MANQNQNNNNDDDEKKDAGGNEGDNQQGNGGNSQGNEGNGGQNQNGGGTNNSGGGSDGGNGGNQSQGKTFSQEDVNRMMAKEKQQGRNAVFNELGINPDDKDVISFIKAFVSARGAGDGDDGGNQGDGGAELAQAQERARIAEMKADAMKAGVKAQYVDDAVELVRARYSDENNDFNAILNELKSKYAIWFEDVEEDDKGGAGKRGTGSTISSKNQQGSKNNQEEGLGKRLAGLRRPQTKKSSYFSS